MVVNETRKRLLRQLNSRYIFGKYVCLAYLSCKGVLRVRRKKRKRRFCLEQSNAHVQTLADYCELVLQPLLHAIVFVIQFTMVTILVRKFNGYYANRPVLTTMIVNAVCEAPHSSSPLCLIPLQVLGGIADTVAQTLTALRMRQRQRKLNPDADGKDDFFAIEINELDKKVPWPEDDFMVPASKRPPPPFDFERLTRFMAYGFLWAPVQHKWYNFLEHTFPLSGGHATGKALRRVAMDQLIFAPIGKRYNAKLSAQTWLIRIYRSGNFLQLHDRCGRRRQACGLAEVSRGLHPGSQSQLHRLAASAGAQLSGHTDSISDRKSVCHLSRPYPD